MLAPARLPIKPLYRALLPPAFQRALIDFSDVAVCSLVLIVSKGYRTAHNKHCQGGVHLLILCTGAQIAPGRYLQSAATGPQPLA